MIILSNCLTDQADEGCRKVVSSLVRRIKKAAPDTTVVTWAERSSLSDMEVSVNKLLISPALARLIKSKKEPVLYLPAPARIRATAIRLWILSRYAKWGIKVLLPMEFSVDRLSAALLRSSGAELIAISAQAYRHYSRFLPDKVTYLKVGVDTDRFCPVMQEQKLALRKKYNLPADKPIVLHVGHLRQSRNIGVFLSLDEAFHGVLVVSTQTAAERDPALQESLAQKDNITVFDTYIPNIQEIYQLSDVYLFPVERPGSCIDAPLSALEAAACAIPVVATPYGELQELMDCAGFYRLDAATSEQCQSLLLRAIQEHPDPRKSVLPYDWKLAIHKLLAGR